MQSINRFRSSLLKSVNTACLHLVSSETSQFGSRWLPPQRTLACSAFRQQESGASEQNSREDFSHIPPLPGQDSALRWGGKKYEELAVVHIKATYNNTHIQVTDHLGSPLALTSCGMEGFKNIKKSTPVAAQTTGISAAVKAANKGVAFVRVVVKGLGPGRQSAIKGLTMGGLQVVSITDNTPVPHNGCRPRKARRV